MQIKDVSFSGFDCTISLQGATVVVSNPSQDFWIFIRYDSAEISRGSNFFATPGRHFSAVLPSGRRVTIDSSGISLSGTLETRIDKIKRHAISYIADLLSSRSKKQS